MNSNGVLCFVFPQSILNFIYIESHHQQGKKIYLHSSNIYMDCKTPDFNGCYLKQGLTIIAHKSTSVMNINTVNSLF